MVIDHIKCDQIRYWISSDLMLTLRLEVLHQGFVVFFQNLRVCISGQSQSQKQSKTILSKT